MRVIVNEEYDLTPEWFEKQAKRDPADAWQEKLCELLTIYRIHDEAGAMVVADKLLELGISKEKLMLALE